MGITTLTDKGESMINADGENLSMYNEKKKVEPKYSDNNFWNFKSPAQTNLEVD